MTDERPRPQYGEYATPEEQQAAIGSPAAAAEVAEARAEAAAARAALTDSGPRYGEAAAVSSAVAGSRRNPPPEPALAPPSFPAAARRGAKQARGSRYDRVFTLGLLFLGALSVASTAFSFSSLGEALVTAFEQQGYGEFTSVGSANVMGQVIIVAQLVLYALAVLLSAWSLRRGRRTAMIPLLIGVLAGLLTVVLLATVIAGDPAFQSWATSQQ